MSQENCATMIGWKRMITLSTTILAVAVVAAAPTISGTSTGKSAPQTTAASRPTVIHSPLKIAALGDSVTAGTNCDCIAFPALYAKELSTARGSHATDCVQDQIDKMRQNIAATVAQIRPLRNGKPTQRLTAEINRAIDDAAKAAGATHVELFASFNGAAAEGNVTNLLIEAGLPGLTAG